MWIFTKIIELLKHDKGLLVCTFICFAIIGVAIAQRAYKVVLAGAFYHALFFFGVYMTLFYSYFGMTPAMQEYYNVEKWSIGFYIAIVGIALLVITSFIGVAKEPCRAFSGKKRISNMLSVILYVILGFLFLNNAGYVLNYQMGMSMSTPTKMIGMINNYQIKEILKLVGIGVGIGLAYPLARVTFTREDGVGRRSMNVGFGLSVLIAVAVGALFIAFNQEIYEWATESYGMYSRDMMLAYFKTNIFELLFLFPLIYLSIAYIVRGKVGAPLVFLNIELIVKLALRFFLKKERFFISPQGYATIDLIACAVAAVLFIFYFVSEKNSHYKLTVQGKLSAKRVSLGIVFAVIFGALFVAMDHMLEWLTEEILKNVNYAEIQTASMLCQYAIAIVYSVVIVLILYWMHNIKNKNKVS